MSNSLCWCSHNKCDFDNISASEGLNICWVTGPRVTFAFQTKNMWLGFESPEQATKAPLFDQGPILSSKVYQCKSSSSVSTVQICFDSQASSVQLSVFSVLHMHLGKAKAAAGKLPLNSTKPWAPRAVQCPQWLIGALQNCLVVIPSLSSLAASCSPYASSWKTFFRKKSWLK